MVELELRLGESSRLWRLSFSGRSVRGFKLLTLVKSVPGMALRYSSGSSGLISYVKIKLINTGVNIHQYLGAQQSSCKEICTVVCFTLYLCRGWCPVSSVYW